MDTPKPGDRATKNGITCFVQFIENGEVSGFRVTQAFANWGSPSNRLKVTADFPPALRLWVGPDLGYLGEFRIALVDWQVAVVDAVYERVG